MLNGEVSNVNVIVFGFIQSGLESTNHSTRSEYASHYTTDAVHVGEREWYIKMIMLYFFHYERKYIFRPKKYAKIVFGILE